MSTRTRVDCLIPIHSRSWVVSQHSLPLPAPCAAGEEERLRFYTQLLIVMIVPGVHVSELLRFDAFMNRNASLFSDGYIVPI